MSADFVEMRRWILVTSPQSVPAEQAKEGHSLTRRTVESRSYLVEAAQDILFYEIFGTGERAVRKFWIFGSEWTVTS